MIGLDTNILVRYFAQDDPNQSPLATDLLEGRLAQDGPGLVNLVTVVETVWVLRRVYRLTGGEIASVLERLLQIENLTVQHEGEVFEAAGVLRRGLGSFEDALIGALNIVSGCTATLTFDKKAARLPGFHLL